MSAHDIDDIAANQRYAAVAIGAAILLASDRICREIAHAARPHSEYEPLPMSEDDAIEHARAMWEKS